MNETTYCPEIGMHIMRLSQSAAEALEKEVYIKDGVGIFRLHELGGEIIHLFFGGGEYIACGRDMTHMDIFKKHINNIVCQMAFDSAGSESGIKLFLRRQSHTKRTGHPLLDTH